MAVAGAVTPRCVTAVATTVMLAVAAFPRTCDEVSALVVLTFWPKVVPITLIDTMQDALAVKLMAVRLTEEEPAAATTVPPQVLDKPFGVVTTRPAGSASPRVRFVKVAEVFGFFKCEGQTCRPLDGKSGRTERHVKSRRCQRISRYRQRGVWIGDQRNRGRDLECGREGVVTCGVYEKAVKGRSYTAYCGDWPQTACYARSAKGEGDWNAADILTALGDRDHGVGVGAGGLVRQRTVSGAGIGELYGLVVGLDRAQIQAWIGAGKAGVSGVEPRKPR